MLCAFANIRDLDRCRAAAVDSSEDIMVYHARRSGTNRTLISCILPQLNEGAGADLRSHFPTVSNDMVREVWENGEGWGVCFDTLKTLQASAGAQGVLVDNCSFLWDTVSWPPLKSSSKEILKNADWEIYEIQTLAEALSELDIAKSDPSDGWEVVNTTGSDGGGGNSSIAAAPAPGPVTRGTVRNYREALLKAPAAKPASHADGEGARKRVATAASWKPAIVVKELKYEHKDKVYQHNLIEQGIDPNALYVEEDEGGYDGGSFFQSNDYAKGSVSLNRMRAATMLRPAALEKKMSRIAAREALRPPPPVSSTAESDGAGARTRAARVAAARAISNSAGPEDVGDSDGYTSD